MKPKTRLDPVVRLREQHEQLSLRAMAESSRKLAAAEAHLTERRVQASRDPRRAAPAAQWLLAELSHTRALSDVRQAESALAVAAEASSVSRDTYTAAHSGAEAMRKITALRVGEILELRDKAERRELDEFSMLRRPAPSEAA